MNSKRITVSYVDLSSPLGVRKEEYISVAEIRDILSKLKKEAFNSTRRKNVSDEEAAAALASIRTIDNISAKISRIQ